jgi:broad specificity phosphatase PhoE
LGQLDVPLASAARRDLRLLRDKCSAHPVSAIYASDLRRTRETAEAIARPRGLAVELRPELREMHFGEWEGLEWDEIVQRFPRLAKLWMERFPHQAIPGAEPVRQFRKRVAAVMGEIARANRGKCALVVTHAGVIRFALGKLLGVPARNVFRLAQDPCAMNIIDYFEHGATVRCVNG